MKDWLLFLGHLSKKEGYIAFTCRLVFRTFLVLQITQECFVPEASNLVGFKTYSVGQGQSLSLF